ncbi:hypothetical protein [Streptomyces sp. NPDC059278]|uniref:hypothetical protein n=1 Tax=Streptomyces sp. NPDC059278 TaxID=3346801 RepID=UPI0036A57D50
MGYYQSAYFAYGLRLPTDGPSWEETDRIDAELAQVKERCPDVGHLSAGDYDHDMVFLVTKCDEVSLGTYGRGSEVSPEERAAWDAQLANAVHALGYADRPELEAPGWLCVPDLS